MLENDHTRRRFIKMSGLGILSLSFPFLPDYKIDFMQDKNEWLVYVGTYTNTPEKSKGIYICKLNLATGALTEVNTAKSVSPSFLALDSSKRYLFAVNEISDFEGKPGGAVSAFAVDQKTGSLTLLNQQSTLGGGPCYITIHKTGKFALVANYGGGNVAVFPIQANGHLSPASDSVQHQGSGINKKRQEKPHAHCIVLDANNQYAFAVDLGLDKILSYKFDAKQGKIKPNQTPFTTIKAGAGPRHLVFHPNNQYAYVINELNSTLNTFAYNSGNGTLKELQTVSTLPEGFSGESFCADIHVSPNGKFLYGSNRGHNSIVVFSIDAKSGKLTYVENVSTQGKWPRNFAIDPTGSLLLVANQHTNNVVSFRIDKQSGKLTPTGQIMDNEKKLTIIFLKQYDLW